MKNKQFIEAFESVQHIGKLSVESESGINNKVIFTLFKDDTVFIEYCDDAKDAIIKIASDVKKYLETGEL